MDSVPKADAAPGVHEKAIEIIVARGGHDRRLLDLPCGEGAMAVALGNRGYRPLCGDIEPARFKVPGVTCERVDLNQTLPFGDESFDDWVCIEGIEHIENPHHLIREARRILRPGGRFIVSTPNTLSVKSRYYNLRFGYPVHFDLMMKKEQEIDGNYTVKHVNPISFIELRYLLEEYGFTVTRIEANRFERRHRVRHAMLDRLLVRKRPLRTDNQREAALRQQLATPALLYGEILLVEAVKK